jgi:hypothetical protein
MAEIFVIIQINENVLSGENILNIITRVERRRRKAQEGEAGWPAQAGNECQGSKRAIADPIINKSKRAARDREKLNRAIAFLSDAQHGAAPDEQMDGRFKRWAESFTALEGDRK